MPLCDFQYRIAYRTLSGSLCLIVSMFPEVAFEHTNTVHQGLEATRICIYFPAGSSEPRTFRSIFNDLALLEGPR